MAKFKLIPLDDKKRPVVENWQNSEQEFDLTGAKGIGVVCGKLSGNLECIDMDLKYDVSKTLGRDYYEMVEKFSPGLFSKLVSAKTKSNGIHLFYKCETIEGNLKLASRLATISEIEQSPNDKVKVLIETRGQGGQVVIHPTPGYEFRNGKTLEDVQEITPAEREILHICARSFNEVIPEVKPTKILNPSGAGMSPWDDYNINGDVHALLEKHGWEMVLQRGPRMFYKRPGTEQPWSGDFHIDKNMFKVFSTSTVFEVNKGYKRFGVYAMLEHGGDYSAAARDLYKQGYGDRLEKSKTKTEENIKQGDSVEDHLADVNEINDYLNAVRENKIEFGKDFGIKKLDDHYRYKRGNLIMINGLDNVGKTTIILFLLTILAKRHSLRFLIYTTENSAGSVYEDIIGFISNKKLKNMSIEEMNKYRDWVSAHFIFVKLQERMYNHKEIIQIAKDVHESYGIDGLLIDPWYSILDGDFDHGNGYVVISDIKKFGQLNKISTIVNIHVGTGAARFKDEEGYVMAPQKADTEGGQKFANVADDFLTIHRLTNHPEDYRFSQIHVRKIKEIKTGGMNTPFDKPIILKMNDNGCGFSYQDSTSIWRPYFIDNYTQEPTDNKAPF